MGSNQDHILIERALTYPRYMGDLSPKDCTYDKLKGAWIVNGNGSLCINLPNRQRPKTKKNDIETGEDQKGE